MPNIVAMSKLSYYIMICFMGFCNLSCHRHYHTFSEQEKNNVLIYGADPTGKLDASHAFQEAMSSHHSVIKVPKGIYRLDKTIEVKRHLFLEAGVKLLRVKECKNREPIIWLSTSNASIEGENKRVLIQSEIPLADGLIKIGHSDASVSNKNILYTSVKNLTIKGSGQVPEKESVGILLFSSQNLGDNTTASFFHTLKDLVIEHLNCAIHLKGFNNANSISNIILNRVGDEYLDAAIYLEGSMENRIYDVFHHYSKNATTLRMDNYIDGNGKTIVPSHNYIFAIVAEQGGASAICTDIRSGKHNTIGVSCNTKLGNKIFDKFEKNKNTLLK